MLSEKCACVLTDNVVEDNSFVWKQKVDICYRISSWVKFLTFGMVEYGLTGTVVCVGDVCESFRAHAPSISGDGSFRQLI